MAVFEKQEVRITINTLPQSKKEDKPTVYTYTASIVYENSRHYPSTPTKEHYDRLIENWVQCRPCGLRGTPSQSW